MFLHKLVYNKRRAKLLTVTCTLTTNETIARSCPINEYSIDRFANDTLKILKQYNKNSSTSNIYTPAIINLGISAGKFLDSVNTKSIADLFSKQTTKVETIRSTENTINWQEEDGEEEDNNIEEKVLEKPITTITTLSIQGDFFRKFKKTDEQINTQLKSENKTTTSSITSFFSRYTTNENVLNSSPNKIDDQYITCSKCHKSILMWNMPEHDDFHYAHELQMEENKTNSIIKTSKPIKRKTNKQKINNQTLDSFINKKPKN
ncbi:unnamed protein product [Rotaria sp. Silwood2]|nr:unnamed protein product [Rotaria sp. Silwood2]